MPGAQKNKSWIRRKHLWLEHLSTHASALIWSVGTFLFDFDIEYMCANRSWYYVKSDEDILKRSDAREGAARANNSTECHKVLQY